MCKGNMLFEGSGAALSTAFKEPDPPHPGSQRRLSTTANNRGHAQRNQNISFNTIQPYPDGRQGRVVPHHHHPAMKKGGRVLTEVKPGFSIFMPKGPMSSKP
jgi:hypothetical protein